MRSNLQSEVKQQIEWLHRIYSSPHSMACRECVADQRTKAIIRFELNRRWLGKDIHVEYRRIANQMIQKNQ